MKKKVEFRSEHQGDDIYGIRVYSEGKPGPWVLFCDPVARRVCTSPGITGKDGKTQPVGWAGSKTQAEFGARELQALYDDGRIE